LAGLPASGDPSGAASPGAVRAGRLAAARWRCLGWGVAGTGAERCVQQPCSVWPVAACWPAPSPFVDGVDGADGAGCTWSRLGAAAASVPGKHQVREKVTVKASSD
jgi:hypothetical protein